MSQAGLTGGNVTYINKKEQERRGQILEVDAPVSAWPVGSTFLSTSSANPNALLGFGTWTAIQSGIWVSIGSVNIYLWKRVS